MGFPRLRGKCLVGFPPPPGILPRAPPGHQDTVTGCGGREGFHAPISTTFFRPQSHYWEGPRALCVLRIQLSIIVNVPKVCFIQRACRIPRVFAQKMEMHRLHPRPPLQLTASSVCHQCSPKSHFTGPGEATSFPRLCTGPETRLSGGAQHLLLHAEQLFQENPSWSARRNQFLRSLSKTQHHKSAR